MLIRTMDRAFCAASSETTAFIGHFVATVLDRVCPARHRNGESIATTCTCTRAVKAGCLASFLSFYKKKKGINTVKAPLHGTRMLFSL